MIDIPFSNGNVYHLPNAWEELSSEQYIVILDLITIFMSGELSLRQFRIKLFLILSGEDIKLVSDPEKLERQLENIWRIASQMNFPLCITYSDQKAFSKLKPDIQDKLYRYLPEELDETPEVRWAAKKVKEIGPDLVFAANLIPFIGRRRHKVAGYSFELVNNIITTSLTTSQFIDAQTVAAEIQQSGKEDLLNLLVAILYSGNSYSGLDANQRAKQLSWLPSEIKRAIFINFNAIQQFLFTRTKYRLLFKEPAESESKNKHHLGLGSVAHSLIKSGFQDIDRRNLIEFFEIMYSETVNNVLTLHRQGLEIDKISEQTGLTIAKINQIL